MKQSVQRIICCTNIFESKGHYGLRNLSIQLIDRENGRKAKRKGGPSVRPSGLNDNDFFYGQKKRSRRARY